MKYMKKFESRNVIEIPYKYKEIVRQCLSIIKSELGVLDEYEEKILSMIATNKTLYSKHGEYIELNDSSFSKNFMYIFDNIKDFYKTVSTTFLNGEIGELVVGDIMANELKLAIKEPTVEENIQGADLISIGRNELWHQVKFIYDYDDIVYDNYNTIKIKSRFLDIKPSDKYDYLWFFVNDKNQALLLKKNDIQIIKIENYYLVKYTKIEKYNVSEKDIRKFREIAYNNIVVGFYDKIDLRRNDILSKFNGMY